MPEGHGRLTRRALALSGAALIALALSPPPPVAGQAEAGTLPEEYRYLGHRLPDLAFRTARGETTLARAWEGRPMLLALVFTRCAGVCSPLLASLRQAEDAVGGRGADYHTTVLSFDPADSAADMAELAQRLGLAGAADWSFGAGDPGDVRRLAEAIGFWYTWDDGRRQFDHPAMLAAVRGGRVVRLLVGTQIEPTRLHEVVRELRGEFVAAYPLPGRVRFRCFQYDPRLGRVALDSGFAILLLPALVAGATTAALFQAGARRRRREGGLLKAS